MQVRAKKGRMVLLHNGYEGRNVCPPDSLHSGMPVIKGQKWAYNLWFRESDYQDPKKVPKRKNTAVALQKFNRVI